ncbi:MAG: hypothetical protein F2520_04965 [Actinobacteria bacterium]|uniref:Unannotated protein n=1 Tax=freshwater metagenome TaxID=449393 RepID=A0A6J5YEY4_9ZZZZ|nr:hypothetical protein [Actinomycetota bacterium]MTA77592.1 hypothetical protein [Actinomycetota bacterium]
MFNVGGGEIIVILLLALLVLGPDKLPSTAKKMGKFLHEFRRMTSGFEQEVRKAMDLGDLGLKGGGSSTSGDAIHRASNGPNLVGPRSTSGDDQSSPAETPTISPSKKAFVADLSDRPMNDGESPAT